MRPLSQTREGEVYQVQWMFGQTEAEDWMKEIDLDFGSLIRVISLNSDAIVIRIGSRRFVIGHAMAERIKVLPCY